MINNLIFEKEVNDNGQIDIIVDRDGVLNKDTGYAYNFKNFILNNCLINILAKHEVNIRSLHVATNQSGISRGYFSRAQFEYNSQLLRDHLLKKGVRLNSLFYCPHLPSDNCRCRKPQNGMLLAISDKFALNYKKTLFIGDKLSDEKCAKMSSMRFKYLRFK